MNYELYSHNEGISVIDSSISSQIFVLIQNINPSYRINVAKNLRRDLLTQLKMIGWSEGFKLDANSEITLTSYYKHIVLCLQTGNMSRFYADLLKLQYAYNIKKASAGIYIIPSKSMAKNIGSNVANYERFTNELFLFNNIITIPLVIIGLK
jgi:hypothetical protein